MAHITRSEAKQRELTRLSNLFERLQVAVRQPQENATYIFNGSDISHDDNTAPTPIFKGNRPLFRGVADFQETRRSASLARLGAQRTRRNTVATMSFDETGVPENGMSEGGETDGSFIASFPLPEEIQEKYTFTFKYKIYKLYEKWEWIRTVEDVLEKSRRDFKPLAETEMPKSPTKRDFHSRCVPMPPGYRRRGSVLTTRQRRTSRDVKPPLSPGFVCIPWQ